MPKIEAPENREPRSAMADAKEFVVSDTLDKPEQESSCTSGCTPGPCMAPPGPPTCISGPNCTPCEAPPNDR